VSSLAPPFHHFFRCLTQAPINLQAQPPLCHDMRTTWLGPEISMWHLTFTPYIVRTIRTRNQYVTTHIYTLHSTHYWAPKWNRDRPHHVSISHTIEIRYYHAPCHTSAELIRAAKHEKRCAMPHLRTTTKSWYVQPDHWTSLRTQADQNDLAPLYTKDTHKWWTSLSTHADHTDFVSWSMTDTHKWWTSLSTHADHTDLVPLSTTDTHKWWTSWRMHADHTDLALLSTTNTHKWWKSLSTHADHTDLVPLSTTNARRWWTSLRMHA
jgi:hypothetical protein